jgi:SAM-dependent methyltransferase
MPARHLAWETGFLADNPAVRTKRFGMPAEAKAVRSPIRLLRYWFTYHLLREEYAAAGHPLEVAEIGVHTGQMLEFYRSAPDSPPVARWTAFDAVVLAAKLEKAGYSEVVAADVEDPGFDIGREYDAAIVLHILEHLFKPEEALKRIARRVRPGGCVIGGFPVLPGFLAGPREARVRRTAAPMGHVSVFSPGRIRRMAAACGLRAEFLAGAYFLRSKGSMLENSPAWMRFNLLWGALFPWWPGEIYWLLRKPAGQPPEDSVEISSQSSSTAS